MAFDFKKSLNPGRFLQFCEFRENGAYSTAIKRFQDQINCQVLRFLQRQNLLGPDFSVALHPDERKLIIHKSYHKSYHDSDDSSGPANPVLLNETRQDINITNSITFAVPALSVSSVEVTTQNVLFEIIGFSSVIVQVSGEAKVVITYVGTDYDNYTETKIIPFSLTQTIPGDYPPNVVATGNVIIGNMVYKTIDDPCYTSISGMTVQLALSAIIRIMLPAA